MDATDDMMTKLDPDTDGRSADLTAEALEQLKRLFPSVVSEGKINLDALRAELGDEVEEGRERYGLSWAGKAQARRIAQTPSTGTLRPVPEDSVNWDTTQNLFIEGDNLEVLKLLQKSYHRKVKLIYIDPPYNTGNDFIYPDDYTDNLATYLKYTDQVDGEGFKTSANPETGGRYHTRWLNMMYPRLKLARSLLRDDGSIAISIDDHEAPRLRLVCDEVFGEENFIATVVWEKVHTRKNSSKTFSVSHDYVIIYARSKARWDRILLPREGESLYKNPDNDPKGPWKTDPIVANNPYSADYTITTPSGQILERPRGGYWRFSEDTWRRKLSNNEVIWSESGGYPLVKRYLSEVQDGLVPVTLFTRDFAGDTASAKRALDAAMGVSGAFEYPKPPSLIQRLLQITTRAGEIVLDFFAGSGSTAEAVLTQNAVDGLQRRFVLVQLPELIEDGSVGAEVCAEEGLAPTIAGLAQSRVRRVVRNVSREWPDDVGYRLLRLSSSNMKTWDPDVEALQEDLLAAVDHIKPDRSAEDVLHEVILKYGLDLSLPIEAHSTGDGRTIYSVADGALLACLDQKIDDFVVDQIVELHKYLAPEVTRVVFLDAGFVDDVVKTNAVQTLRLAGIEDVRSI